jgi:hypothetical protein
MVLVGLGILVSLGGTNRWWQLQQAMAHGEDLPRTRMPLLLGSALALLAGAVVVAVLLLAPVTPRHGRGASATIFRGCRPSGALLLLRHAQGWLVLAPALVGLALALVGTRRLRRIPSGATPFGQHEDRY